jgi:hypothetical protein
MMKKHIISFLDRNDPVVLQELESDSSVAIYFFKEEVTKLSSAEDKAYRIKKMIDQLMIKVGQEAVILAENHNLLEIVTCVTILQRRFNETVKIYVKNSSGVQELPSPLDINRRDDNRSSMVNYNYSSCSGDCSSCKS